MVADAAVLKDSRPVSEMSDIDCLDDLEPDQKLKPNPDPDEGGNVEEKWLEVQDYHSVTI